MTEIIWNSRRALAKYACLQCDARGAFGDGNETGPGTDGDVNPDTKP